MRDADETARTVAGASPAASGANPAGRVDAPANAPADARAARRAFADANARLFVALWPDAGVRRTLVRWRDRWHWPASARLVAARDLHVTLHFLGAVPRDTLPALRDALAWSGPAFELHLGPVLPWSGGLAVVGIDDPPPSLFALHAAIAGTLRALGHRPEARAFEPHLTLARRAPGARPPDTPLDCRWTVHEFVLVESGGPAGPGYHVLRRYRPNG